jgi:hypothetical protein
VTGVGVAGMAVRRCRKVCEVGILRPAIWLVALKRDLFRGAIAFGVGAELVKQRQHAQLALGHLEDRANRVTRLDAMVQVKAFQQLAEGARFARVRHGADRGNELAATPGAGQHGQRRCVGQPDSVDIGDKVEGPVQADAVRRQRGGLVGAVGEDQGFAGGESLVAQLAVPGTNEAGVGPQDEVGAVVPLGRVGGASARDGVGIGEEETLHLARRDAGDAVDRLQACAERRQLLSQLHGAQVPVAAGRHRSWFLPPAFHRHGRMDERHGTRQRSRRAQQRHQIGAWWEQGRVADVDHQGPQLVETQFSKMVGLRRIEPVPNLQQVEARSCCRPARMMASTFRLIHSTSVSVT